MFHRTLNIGFICSVAMTCSTPSENPEPIIERPAGIEGRVEAILAPLEAKVSLHAKHLPSGNEIAIEADRPANTLSVIKIAILVQAFRDFDAGLLDLDERYTLKLEDRRGGAGLLYTYAPGLKPTFRDLVTQMIIVSDNMATDIMINRLGLDRINATLGQLGYPETRLQGTLIERYRRRWELLDPANASLTNLEVFERGSPADAGAAQRHFKLNSDPNEWMGRTTARETSRLLEQIHLAQVASQESSKEMIEILKKQERDTRIPRRLRFEFDGVAVAHKTGDSPPSVANDVGILYYQGGPSILSVFVNENRGDYLEVERAIGDVAVELLREWR